MTLKEFASLGGIARARRLSAARRTEIAVIGGRTRQKVGKALKESNERKEPGAPRGSCTKVQ